MSLPVVADNYFEELLGFPTNNYANVGGRNALVALIGTVVSAAIRDNLFNMGQAPNGSNPLYVATGATDTHVTGNLFNNSNNGNTGSIWNLTMSLKGGPNTYNQSVHMAGGGSWGLNYGGN